MGYGADVADFADEHGIDNFDEACELYNDVGDLDDVFDGRDRSRSPRRSQLFDVDGTPCFWLDTQSQVDSSVAKLALLASVAVDVEGENLGHKGRAATIQLATQEACYIVDLAKLGVPQSLRELLQGSLPLKICHGFSGDQINLIEQYGLDFGGAALFDTQVAARAIPSYAGRESVVDILEHFADNVPKSVLDEMRRMKKQLQFVDFFARPLPRHVARYSCLDVIYLSEAAAAMQELLPRGGREDVLTRSRYWGPWARGECYMPPSQRAKEEKAKKGLVWSEEERDFVRRR